VVGAVRLEGVDSVRGGWGTVGVGLSSAWVLRVDKSTVGADLDGSSTGWICGESKGVGPADRGARRGCEVGGSGVGLGSSSSLGNRGCGLDWLVCLVHVPEEEGWVTCLNTALGLLSSRNASRSSSCCALRQSLVVGRFGSDAGLGALSNGINEGVELINIESLRRRRSGNEGSSP
jgi:hypothetical protein